MLMFEIYNFPSFFDVMSYLVIHFVKELEQCGLMYIYILYV